MSLPPSSMFARLPAVILPKVCSYLSIRELLLTLSQTSNSTRALLTPACFSSHPLNLGSQWYSPRLARSVDVWTQIQEMQLPTAFPRLQHLEVYADEDAVDNTGPAARSMLPFLHVMANCDLTYLDFTTAQPVALDAASMAQLARCHQLKELYVSISTKTHMDWPDASLFTSFSLNCFSHLHSISLETVRVCAETVVAFDSAAPQLQRFYLRLGALSCHPAVVMAILGGYCEQIEYVENA